MTNVEVKNMAFKPEMELWVKGVPSKTSRRFSINVGTDEKNIALYFSVHFNDSAYQNVIIMNYVKAGVQGEEVRVTDFPFHPDKEFEVTITFDDKFHIKLPGDQMVIFPDNLAATPYNKIWVDGEVKVRGISIK
ncbi:galactose-binding lectin l-1-like [Anguilla anguilla]|uniref:galactose-binding lectin l-1-like n=1 Tax=Anguilla anguilla TaxID=7936 RepID=UPI0015ACC582|nr:galactose-binding lectin l-1-like [Anguilla anguilla]